MQAERWRSKRGAVAGAAMRAALEVQLARTISREGQNGGTEGLLQCLLVAVPGKYRQGALSSD